MISPNLIKSICQTQCATQWCCSIRHFSAPPLRLREIDAIAGAGHRDFVRRRGETPVLRTADDEYCVCFDRTRRSCGIYSLRPGDCRLFPFDFFRDGNRRFRWLMWDCPLSRRLTETDIRTGLLRLEREQAGYIRETWAYGLEDYPDVRKTVGGPKIRLLRPLRLLPWVPPLCGRSSPGSRPV